jgi:intracellular sulfur oxidation DsrE/DsrF family protein
MESRRFERRATTSPGRFSRRLANRRLCAGLAGVAAGIGGTRVVAQEATPTGSDQQVVLHVSDPDGWPPALSNLHNLTTQFPEMRVLVVVDGGGVYLFQGANDLTAELEVVAAAGVRIQACRNALDEKQIDPDTVPAFVQVIPGGVPALVDAQNQGYRYVKP